MIGMTGNITLSRAAKYIHSLLTSKVGNFGWVPLVSKVERLLHLGLNHF